MIFMLGVVCGILVYMAISAIASLCTPLDGYLRVDRSDIEPYLFLEVNKSIDEISGKKTVKFQVKNEDFISHD